MGSICFAGEFAGRQFTAITRDWEHTWSSTSHGNPHAPSHTPTHSHTNAYNLENIAAIDFNFCTMILTSSHYTGKEFRVTPTSGLGGESTRVDRVQKHRFMPHFGSSPFSTGGLL